MNLDIQSYYGYGSSQSSVLNTLPSYLSRTYGITDTQIPDMVEVYPHLFVGNA